jgi:hypothetical protein
VEIDRIASERAAKHSQQVAACIDSLMRRVQQRMGGVRRRTADDTGDHGEKVIVSYSEESLKLLMKKIVRDINEVGRHIDILDEQLNLFARARDKLDFRYRVATGTRTAFLRDIRLMTGGLPGEPYVASDDITTIQFS